MEPTPELAQAIERIRKFKNIKDLRRLHKDFGQYIPSAGLIAPGTLKNTNRSSLGHLFCQSLTLGGRLQSTKTITVTKEHTENSQKDTFKTSVGVAVSTPWVNASVKHDEEKSTETSNERMEKNTQENVVFEAVGGDTILANK